jgi:hypothetical protein
MGMNELGWFGSSTVRKAKKPLKRVQTAARKVYKPIAAVERVVRPIGKRIPIVGEFAQLHEDITVPLERRVLGLKGKPKKSKAEQLATLVVSAGAEVSGGLRARGLPSGPQAVRSIQAKAAKQLRTLASGGGKNATAMFDLAVKAKAMTSRGPVSAALQKASKAGALVTPAKLAAATTAAKRGVGAPSMARAGVYLVVTPDGRRVEVPASKVR